MTIHSLNKIKFIGAIIAIVAVVGIVGVDRPETSLASGTDNVHGWLWSDMSDGSDQVKTPGNAFGGRGLGWISVNSSDAGAGGNYGVSLDLTTGVFSGYGWSEYGGWLDFHPTATPPTTPGNYAAAAKIDPTCLADASITSCVLTGWLKFNAGGTNQSGGWDGWVSLSGATGNGAGYSVRYEKSTKQFSGWAWGDWVAGWINFDRMKIETVVEPTLCTDPFGNPIVCPQVPLFCQDPAGNVISYQPNTPMPAACTQVSCTAGGVTYWYPVNGPIPGECIGTTTFLVCTDAAGNRYRYPQGTPRPSQCVRDTDLCPFIGGNQTGSGPWTDPDTGYQWYLTGAGVCTIDACSGSNYGMSGFQPDVPIGYSRGPNNTCVPIVPCTPGVDCPTTGPIKPIFIEN